MLEYQALLIDHFDDICDIIEECDDKETAAAQIAIEFNLELSDAFAILELPLGNEYSKRRGKFKFVTEES